MYTYVSIMNPIYEWWRLSRLSKHSYSTIRTSLVRSWCMLWKVCSDSELVDWQGIKTGLLVSLQRLQQELAEQAKLQSNRTYKSFSLTQLQESKTRFIEAGSGSLSYFFFSRGDFPAALSGDWSKSRWDLRVSKILPEIFMFTCVRQLIQLHWDI